MQIDGAINDKRFVPEDIFTAVFSHLSSDEVINLSGMLRALPKKMFPPDYKDNLLYLRQCVRQV